MKKHYKTVVVLLLLCAAVPFAPVLRHMHDVSIRQAAVQAEAARVKYVSAKLRTVAIKSDLDGVVQKAYYYPTHSQHKKPLVVMLHTWRATYRSLHAADGPIPPQQVFNLDWNYIQPDFRGSNDHPDACGSDKTVHDIDQAIDFAIKQGNVDTSRIYIVGASGGGYEGLVYFMKSARPIAGYDIWVPVTDLVAFYFQGMSKLYKYDEDILKCTSSKGSELNFTEAARRSPMYMQTPVEKLKHGTFIHLYTGIHDGERNLIVPISHSIRMYNKILKDERVADSRQYVSHKDMAYMLQNFASPYKMSIGKLQGGQNILYIKRTGSLSLTIFDGGHDIDFGQVFHDLNGG